MRQAEPGDRVLLQGVIESVHDGFVMVKVDHVAPHAIPQRYDLVAVQARHADATGPHVTRLTAGEADRLAQERPPYPPKSDVPAEQCTGPTGWHRPLAEDWNRGNRESTCTWCRRPVARNFCDPVWRAEPAFTVPP